VVIGIVEELVMDVHGAPTISKKTAKLRRINRPSGRENTSEGLSWAFSSAGRDSPWISMDAALISLL
jgi:hypothetical protein